MADVLDLYQACLDRLVNVDPPQPTLTIYDGKVPDDPAAAYAAYYASPGVALNARLAQVPGRMSWSFFVVCVGDEPAQTLWVAAFVRSRFAGWRPDPDGSATPLNEVDLGNEILPDDIAPGHTRHSYTLRYTLTTTRSLTNG